MVRVTFGSLPWSIAESDRISVHAHTDIVTQGRASNNSFEAFQVPMECTYMGGRLSLIPRNSGQSTEKSLI
jgi:hypothetical protein